MAQEISGFIDFDPDGKPYMGLIVTTETSEIKFYLSHKQNTGRVVNLTVALQKLTDELKKTPDKIVSGKESDLSAFRRVRDT